jgi:hypothetical protein
MPMSDGDDAFSTTVTLTRGTGSRDKDKLKVKVSAPSVDALDRRVRDVREKMESWAGDFRQVQPTEGGRSTPDDQTDLGSVEA